MLMAKLAFVALVALLYGWRTLLGFNFLTYQSPDTFVSTYCFSEFILFFHWDYSELFLVIEGRMHFAGCRGGFTLF